MEFNDFLFDNERAMSFEDKRVLNIMEFIVVLKEGYYEIAMLWRYFLFCLLNNRVLVEYRLKLLRRRFVKDLVFFQKYSVFIDNFFDRVYVRKVLDNRRYRLGEVIWFLSYYLVFYLKKFEKVRVVFDCVVKYKGVFFNDVLL